MAYRVFELHTAGERVGDERCAREPEHVDRCAQTPNDVVVAPRAANRVDVGHDHAAPRGDEFGRRAVQPRRHPEARQDQHRRALTDVEPDGQRIVEIPGTHGRKLMGNNVAMPVIDNPAESRYEISYDEKLAGIATYRLSGNRIVFIHTEIDPAFEGHGLGHE